VPSPPSPAPQGNAASLLGAVGEIRWALKALAEEEALHISALQLDSALAPLEDMMKISAKDTQPIQNYVALLQVRRGAAHTPSLSLLTNMYPQAGIATVLPQIGTSFLAAICSKPSNAKSAADLSLSRNVLMCLVGFLKKGGIDDFALPALDPQSTSPDALALEAVLAVIRHRGELALIARAPSSSHAPHRRHVPRRRLAVLDRRPRDPPPRMPPDKHRGRSHDDVVPVLARSFRTDGPRLPRRAGVPLSQRALLRATHQGRAPIPSEQG